METVELVKVERNDLGRVKYTVAITDERGTHTETFGNEVMAKFLYKGLEIEVNDEQVADELKFLSPEYMELAEDVTTDDNSNEIEIYDIYSHTIRAYAGILEIDREGQLEKTYKRKAYADKFMKKVR